MSKCELRQVSSLLSLCMHIKDRQVHIYMGQCRNTFSEEQVVLIVKYSIILYICVCVRTSIYVFYVCMRETETKRELSGQIRFLYV